MNAGDLESTHPWLRLPEDTDREALLEQVRENLASQRFRVPDRALGAEMHLRGEARILKQYLNALEPRAGERHYIYKLRSGVIAAVSLGAEGATVEVTGAPPGGLFWEWDFLQGVPDNPSRVIRRSRPGDRFLYKLAARADGIGYESESVITCEQSGEPELLLIKTVRENQSPERGSEVLRALVRQGEAGECFEYGPADEPFERPAISRRSPMVVGQYYSTLYYYSDICCEEYVTVEALEEVTVPAGTFEAFRLRLQSPLPERISWFAPSLNAMVRERVECEGYFSQEVLHEYELG